MSRDILFILCLFSFIGPYNHPCDSLKSNNSLIGSSFFPVLLHCCSDSLSFVCSSSSHDNQGLPQGSSWCAKELGPRLCGSLQLDHGHLLSRESCHRLVSKSPTTFCVCALQLNQCFLCILSFLWLFPFGRETPSQNLSGILSPSIGNLTNLETV